MSVFELVQDVHVLDVGLHDTIRQLGRALDGEKPLDRAVRLLLFGEKIDFLTGPITTSFDAAMALSERVAPGWYWECSFGQGWQAFAHGAPEPWPEGLVASDRGGVYVTATTVPLALCLATLRVRFSEQPQCPLP